jgi:hypothetical protein
MWAIIWAIVKTRIAHIERRRKAPFLHEEWAIWVMIYDINGKTKILYVIHTNIAMLAIYGK